MAVFDAVARTENVSEAGREIGLTQSAMSMALKDFEDHLGLDLFNREHKKLTLNENGRKLQPLARSMLIAARDIENLEGSRTYRGILNIGAGTIPGGYLLPGLCATFMLSHPNVKIRLNVHPTLHIIEQVDSMQMDLGIVDAPSSRSTLNVTRWCQDELVIFANSSHRLAKSEKIQPRELVDETWCLLPTTEVARTVFMLSILNHIDAIQIGFESSSVEAIKRVGRSRYAE